MTGMEVLVKDGSAIIAERKAKRLDRYDEVHHGRYIVMNAPGGAHQRVVMQLATWLQDRGITSVPGVNVGDSSNFREPDVAGWLGQMPDAVWYEGGEVPDIVIEIISESNSPEEMIERRTHYRVAGVGLYVEVELRGELGDDQLARGGEMLRRVGSGERPAGYERKRGGQGLRFGDKDEWPGAQTLDVGPQGLESPGDCFGVAGPGGVRRGHDSHSLQRPSSPNGSEATDPTTYAYDRFLESILILLTCKL